MNSIYHMLESFCGKKKFMTTSVKLHKVKKSIG